MDNIVQRVTFDAPTDAFRIVNELTVETFAPDVIDWKVPRGTMLSESEASSLAPYLLRQDPSDDVAEFARAAFAKVDGHPVWFVSDVNYFLNREFTQIIRETGDPLEPGVTFSRREGACRDYSVLLMDAARSVGIPARFVSGYQQADIDLEHRHLHAWVEVYVSSLGWIGFDPTMGEQVSTSHIPLAAAAIPSDASPVSGSFWSFRASSQLECSLALSAR